MGGGDLAKSLVCPTFGKKIVNKYLELKILVLIMNKAVSNGNICFVKQCYYVFF